MWAWARVIGTGKPDDPFRAAVAEHGVDHAASIPTDAAGQPLRPWCIVTFAPDPAKQAAIGADPGVLLLPDGPGKRLADAAPADEAKLLARASAAFGVTVDRHKPVEEILHEIGRPLEAGFDVAALRVSADRPGPRGVA